MLHRPFELQVSTRDGGASVVAVTGELDISAAADLRRVIGMLMGGGARHVEVDMAETSFLDSTGLGALLWAEHRLDAAGGDLAVVRPSAAVTRVLELSGLDALVH